jgi:hypothetical protein
MVRKSRREPFNISQARRNAMDRTLICNCIRYGVPLNLTSEHYVDARPWIMACIDLFEQEGSGILAGYARADITDHDRRYGITED